MNKFLSYLYPITKKVYSDINGTLEITWHNGKKHLNTLNANYSYGSLQEILKIGLKKIDLKSVQSVLLLGLGGGSVIETLRRDFNYTKSITAVDIDPVIIDLAKSEFNIIENENLQIICADALKFMASNALRFDLIIIDLFIDIEVPGTFLDLSFWKNTAAACTPNGSILFNAAIEKQRTHALNKVIDFLKTRFYKTEIHENVKDTNTLIIAKGLWLADTE